MRSVEHAGHETPAVASSEERQPHPLASKLVRSEDEATPGARVASSRDGAPGHAEQWAMTPGLASAMGLVSADEVAGSDEAPRAPHHAMPPPSWSATVAAHDQGGARSRDEASDVEAVAAEVPLASAPAAARGAQPPGREARGDVTREGALGGEREVAGDATERVADIVGEPIVDSHDAVKPTIGYSGSISQGGVALATGEFGRTDSTPTLKNVSITKGKGGFTVTATYELTTKWDTRKGTGPNGQKDVPDESAAVLTKSNYATAASDLTPDLSDEGGRPPRTQFWAQDLTEKHEQVHAKDHQKTAKEGLKRALSWLKGQTANTKADVEALLVTVQQKIVQYILANGAGSVGELHAYGDGASAYQKRAKAIKKKGDKGGYP